MKRDLRELGTTTFDLLIVGGGIYGACAARDAVERGLSVALVERSDFAAATSANPYKVVHGGIRYLQHLDFWRTRQSAAERNTLLRIAPHLVSPLPIVVPTYGMGRKGKALLGAGSAVYDFFTLDRNRGIGDSARRIPKGRIISRREVCRLFPKLVDDGATGGLVFFDGQIYSPPRLALAFLRSAATAGAVVANYLEVTQFLAGDKRVSGVLACDRLSNTEVEIRAKVVLNATGPWAAHLLSAGAGIEARPAPSFSRDVCLVMNRSWSSEYGLAVAARNKDPDAVFSRGARHLFAVPWRDYTLIGVWHRVHGNGPDEVSVTETELSTFVEEINEAMPGVEFSRAEISKVNSGLVLFGENDPDTKNLSYGKRTLLIDHRIHDKLAGIISLIGVRYTTARRDAAKAVDLVVETLGIKAIPCNTAAKPVHGGDIEDLQGLLKSAYDTAVKVPRASLEALVRNHGSGYGKVLSLVGEDPRLARPLGPSKVIAAEVVYAAREEMALKLSDVVERRTDLGSAGDPGETALLEAAQLMREELGWSEERTQGELAEVRSGAQGQIGE